MIRSLSTEDLLPHSLAKPVSPTPNSSPSARVCNSGLSLVSGRYSWPCGFYGGNQIKTKPDIRIKCRANKQKENWFVRINQMIFLHTEKKPAARATMPNRTDGNLGSNESFKTKNDRKKCYKCNQKDIVLKLPRLPIGR